MTTTHSKPHGLYEWFFRKETLAQATKNALDEARRTSLTRANETLVVADHLLELALVEDTRGSAGAAISLYREALYWALLALEPLPEGAGASLTTVFRSVPRHRLAAIAGSGAALLALEDTLVRDGFADNASLSLEARVALANRAKRFVTAVLDAARRPDERVERVRRQRVARPLSLLAFVFAIALGAFIANRIVNAPKDLANDRPFIASSQHGPWPLTGHVNRTIIDGAFFHTLPTHSPWIRVDLGRERSISRVEIENRTTGYHDRALPLTLGVSTDGSHFRTVGRRQDAFETWEARFTRVRARYLRLSVQGRVTELHLAGIHVYER